MNTPKIAAILSSLPSDIKKKKKQKKKKIENLSVLFSYLKLSRVFVYLEGAKIIIIVFFNLSSRRQ